MQQISGLGQDIWSYLHAAGVFHYTELNVFVKCKLLHFPSIQIRYPTLCVHMLGHEETTLDKDIIYYTQ